MSDGYKHCFDDYCETVRVLTCFSVSRATLADRAKAAIDEIERLQRELDSLTNEAAIREPYTLKLEEENERLRRELDAANERFAALNTPTGREIELIQKTRVFERRSMLDRNRRKLAIAEIERLHAAIREIRRLAAENYDPAADPNDECPEDMTQHVNGLIVRLCDEC